ncbi:dicarboxylate/amino acid:cation symporter [Ornithobacterium rhinotracheale]|uniref:dicarboxylate/amino acid:cation symporter n=1 Tax=Ornithobacterium rhinotracheale TaxID=28251 RepID=UPI001FF1264C|nr:dicarboxylate/amino acid:cation symporter [Ornithobacterium rhinotracheale]MCK0200881.1 dicarboxylate/amino acid:cation symporter [Ornithobacterium rhinotracheale]UVD87233.1 dicarboxylate/amino acid:cation symporter [Ornithobacterium rhinotracheale]
MKKLELHWQIMIGMVLGVAFGYAMTFWSYGAQFISDWIAPFGTIFIKLLKLIAIPLILASLVKGISDLQDISKFKNMGIRTIGIYICTTIVAIVIGLSLVNLFAPGKGIPQETIDQLTATYTNNADISDKINTAASQKAAGPLNFLVEMVPDNIIGAMTDNGMMLQIIFFAIFVGISLLLVDDEKAKPLKDFFDSLNEVVLKMVDLIMLTAPFAVFALLSNVIVSSNDPEILEKLAFYAGTVVIGLTLLVVFYVTAGYIYTKKTPKEFFKAMSPAQLLAFSTSSSAATLPVTMERVNEHLGVDEEVSSFVLPVGATINMDGTSLYQAVAAVFIAQAMKFPLEFSDQITIVLTALMASIGSAAVPGAGMVMLVIVLESIGFPADKLAVGLALIFAVDRPLDMFRTVVNITGDAFVSLCVGKSLNKLHTPKARNWDDNYKMRKIKNQNI